MKVHEVKTHIFFVEKNFGPPLSPSKKFWPPREPTENAGRPWAARGT